MPLQDPIGIWFSELKDNWENREFFYDFSMHQNQRHNDICRHYGDFPDGRRYGAFIFPCSDPWPSSTDILIMKETGELETCTPAEYESWDLPNHWPLTIVSSPSGKSLVWIIEKELRAWHPDPKEERFMRYDSDSENRLGDKLVKDAKMYADGILELLCEDGEILHYLCDENIVLAPWEDGWIPADEREHSELFPWKNGMPQKKDRFCSFPDSFILMVRKEDAWAEFMGCGVRRVCFEPGLERLEGEILSSNPNLETVTIPASIQYVDFGAFMCCTNLKKLVIEGDLSRIANWDKEAFYGCPCEEQYLSLRNSIQ
ncbi:MAG: leucine-rich repeat protein [Coriobacteriales bacterium]|nr:leucine-rich repeat protein [Coriobacteriales bacterium]